MRNSPGLVGRLTESEVVSKSLESLGSDVHDSAPDKNLHFK
jgi:hypothetical protein